VKQKKIDRRKKEEKNKLNGISTNEKRHFLICAIAEV